MPYLVELYYFVGARTRASDPNTFQPPPFGEGAGPIFWDDVRCTGSEQRLEECPHLTTPQGSTDCIHNEDVGVTCQPLPTTSPLMTTSKLQLVFSMYLSKEQSSGY